MTGCGRLDLLKSTKVTVCAGARRVEEYFIGKGRESGGLIEVSLSLILYYVLSVFIISHNFYIFIQTLKKSLLSV